MGGKAIDDASDKKLVQQPGGKKGIQPPAIAIPNVTFFYRVGTQQSAVASETVGSPILCCVTAFLHQLLHRDYKYDNYCSVGLDEWRFS